MRPHTDLVEALPGSYPESINKALGRYLFLVSQPPAFSSKEWSLLQDVCLEWKVETESLSPALAQRLLLQVKDAIKLGKLDQKWRIDGDALCEKIGKLTLLEAMATIHAIELFWHQAE